MKEKFLYVRICGTGMDQTIKVLSHDVKEYPANTYHVFEMPNGATFWLNDFGVKSLTIADSPDKLN